MSLAVGSASTDHVIGPAWQGRSAAAMGLDGGVDIATRGDVALTADGRVANVGRWSGSSVSRPGFEVFLEAATTSDSSEVLGAVDEGEEVGQGPVDSGRLSGIGSPMHEGVAGDGLGASVFRIATGADIPGLTSLVLGAFDPFGAGPSVRSETMSDRRAEWRPMFIDAARRHGIDPDLLLAVAEVESSFETDAISPAGAQGLMQFMPATAKEMGVDPFEPASAIDGAARYLAREMDRFGRVDLAVAAYNAGAGAVQRHGGIPPFQETQRYVEKVFAAWRTP